jgi:hypothetical protein
MNQNGPDVPDTDHHQHQPQGDLDRQAGHGPVAGRPVVGRELTACVPSVHLNGVPDRLRCTTPGPIPAPY